MDNMLAVETRYRDYQQQTAWINAENWKFEKPEKRYRVRKAIAQALMAVAARLAPDATRLSSRQSPAAAQ